jgi:peptidoglycan/LPS O-acetylase OafA/YrhL
VSDQKVASTKAKDLPSLTSLRAIAALLVFSVHVKLFEYGSVGVTFFFVLSGFVLTWGYRPNGRISEFYLRRFARIYPLHFVIWAAMVFVPVLAIRDNSNWFRNILNLFLVQSWSFHQIDMASVAAVTWSLSAEAFFYLCFPFLVRWLSRLSIKTLWMCVGSLYSIVAALTLLATVARSAFWGAVLYANPLVRLPEFMIGIAIGLTVRAGVRIKWQWAVLPLAVASVGFALVRVNPALNVWGTLIFAVTIAWFAQRDVANKIFITGNRAFVYAGKISFAFYMIHLFVIDKVSHFLVDNQVAHAHWIGVFLSLALASALAAILHHTVEMPAHNLIVRLATARKEKGAK